VKPLRTLSQVQNEIGADSESRLLELFQAVVYDVRLAVDKKDAQRTAPMRGRPFRTETLQIRLDCVLRQSCHLNLHPEQLNPPMKLFTNGQEVDPYILTVCRRENGVCTILNSCRTEHRPWAASGKANP
jgi:hypothetical protein